MAKLPEYYAEEKAKKALERQAKVEERRKAKEAEQEAQMAQEALAKARKKNQLHNITEAEEKKKTKIKEIVELTNSNQQMSKSILNNVELKGTQKFTPYTKEDKYAHGTVNECETNERGNPSSKDKKELVRLSEKKKAFYNNQHKLVNSFFFEDKFIPIYNKYCCSCCGRFKPIEKFNRSYSFANLDRIDDSSQFHLSICTECSQKLYYYHYFVNCNKQEELAMQRWCCDTNTYWDIEIYREARKVLDNNPTAKNIVPNYIAALGRTKKMGVTYWDSPVLWERDVPEQKLEVTENNQERAPIHWSKEEAKLKKKIINMFRYDPFSMYNEDVARNLYFNLDLMIDETMTEDIMKLKAAVEIVCSHQKIEELRLREMQLEKEGASDKEIKEVIDRRMKELKQITDFAKENGLSERSATKKAKGAGTLTGVMNEMREKMYEPGLVDYYGVKTCKEMQEVANMSFKAVMDQLMMKDNEAWGLVTKQTQKIKTLNAKVDELTEKLRRLETEKQANRLIELAQRNEIEDLELVTGAEVQGIIKDKIEEQSIGSWVGYGGKGESQVEDYREQFNDIKIDDEMQEYFNSLNRTGRDDV